MSEKAETGGEMVTEKMIEAAARAFSQVAHDGGGVVGDGDELLEQAMRAALEAAEAAAWEPIETAPKDGTKVLVRWKYRNIPEGHPGTEVAYYSRRGSWLDIHGLCIEVHVGPHRNLGRDITAWAPIPTIPKDIPHA